MGLNQPLETIKKVGIFNLCGTDGCYCINFSVHHVRVNVSCRKSGGCRNPGGTTVVVSSGSMDYLPSIDSDGPAYLQQVGDEVKRQLEESDPGYSVLVFVE